MLLCDLFKDVHIMQKHWRSVSHGRLLVWDAVLCMVRAMNLGLVCFCLTALLNKPRCKAAMRHFRGS